MKDSLIGINEGIEELTLTLLIGIKADLLQFIFIYFFLKVKDKLKALFSHCSSNNCLFLKKEFQGWLKFSHITGHWQLWQKVYFRPCLHMCGTIDVEAYIGIVQRHILPSRWHLSLSLWLLDQDNARSHSACATTAWFCRHVDVTAFPAYLYPIENVWPIMKRRIRQQWLWTVEQLKSCIKCDWAKILLAKLYKLASLIPDD